MEVIITWTIKQGSRKKRESSFIVQVSDNVTDLRDQLNSTYIGDKYWIGGVNDAMITNTPRGDTLNFATHTKSGVVKQVYKGYIAIGAAPFWFIQYLKVVILSHIYWDSGNPAYNGYFANMWRSQDTCLSRYKKQVME